MAWIYQNRINTIQLSPRTLFFSLNWGLFYWCSDDNAIFGAIFDRTQTLIVLTKSGPMITGNHLITGWIDNLRKSVGADALPFSHSSQLTFSVSWRAWTTNCSRRQGILNKICLFLSVLEGYFNSPRRVVDQSSI